MTTHIYRVQIPGDKPMWITRVGTGYGLVHTIEAATPITEEEHIMVMEQLPAGTKAYLDVDMGKVSDLEVDGVDMNDYPDFCDAFICNGNIYGRELTDVELDIINENHTDLIHQLATESVF